MVCQWGVCVLVGQGSEKRPVHTVSASREGTAAPATESAVWMASWGLSRGSCSCHLAYVVGDCRSQGWRPFPLPSFPSSLRGSLNLLKVRCSHSEWGLQDSDLSTQGRIRGWRSMGRTEGDPEASEGGDRKDARRRWWSQRGVADELPGPGRSRLRSW